MRDWKTTAVGLVLAVATSVSMAPDVFGPKAVAAAKALVVLLTALFGAVARDSHPDAHAQFSGDLDAAAPTQKS